MKKYLFMAFIAFVLCGCKESSPFQDRLFGGSYYTSRYITNYIVTSKIVVENNDGTLCLKVSGQSFDAIIPDEEALYFADLYNDNCYKGGVWPFRHVALAHSLDKITISCDKDFDAEHLAGEPLDDIAQLEFASYYPFIENGYNFFSKDNWKYRDCIGYTMNFDSINAKIAKLIKVEFVRESELSDVAKIEFASQPAEPGEYTFTLEVTTNGETLKTEFTHTFE